MSPLGHPQKNFFLGQEGDNWHNRNASMRAFSKGVRHMSTFIRDGMSVLEIGCSSGRNLDYFSQQAQGEFVGIDPSDSAVMSGREQFKHILFYQGTADELPFDDDSFDIIFFGFCFYVIDPSLLTKVVHQADRLLKNGGYLGIMDFDYPAAIKKNYGQHDGVFTYKYKYADLFLGFPQYTLVEKVSFSHQGEDFHPDADERLSLSVMNKNLSEFLII